MIVAFDAVCLADGAPTGVARAFVTGLREYAEEWPDDMLVLVPEGSDPSELPNVAIRTAPTGAWRRQRALPRLLAETRADVLHSAVAAVPLRAPCPTIATVHDLPWLHPESGERSTWWRRFATRRALAAAAVIIAPSQFTRDAAARIVKDPGKLVVVPHSTPAPPENAAPSPSGRNGPFVVFGDDRPRKNHARIRAAHALAIERATARGEDLPPLRFVGPRDWLPECDKPALLADCRGVIACSLYEGFGLPVLEAAMHEAPLICSDIPPHREIAPPHAVFVDPTDVAAMAAAFGAELPQATPAERPRIAATWRSLHASLAAGSQ
ncbi:MAG: glycosyltransferase [bacterium]|nr:glycosyltransferase [bacterium]